MERLTEKDNNGYKLVLKNAVECVSSGDLKKWSISESSTGTQTIRGFAVDKLAEYEDLEEQGKLLKLPCKVGDTLFHVGINPMRIREFSVFGIDILAESVIISTEEEISFDIEHIGKTFFLTREQAEKVLDKLKGGAEE